MTSSALSVALPIVAPVRLQHAFSHAPHPNPVPDFTPHTINPASTITKAAAEAKRREEAAQQRNVLNRGAGFSLPVTRRRRSSLDVTPTESKEIQAMANAPLERRSSMPSGSPPLLSVAPAVAADALSLDASSGASPAPIAALSSVASAIPSPSPIAAAAAASPTLQASEAMQALAKPGSQRSDHEVDSIASWVRRQNIEFFAEVDEPTLKLLCQRMHARQCERREIVMREGTMADALFILISGGVSIWNESFRDHEALDALLDQAKPTNKDSASEGTISILPSDGSPAPNEARNLTDLIKLLGRRPKHITTIHATASQKPAFGELGLMSEQLRTATVIAEGPPSAPTSFLIIDKHDFDSVLKRRQKDAFLEKILVLKQLKVFSTVSERQLVKISIYFDSITLPPNTVIIQQGSVADMIYFLVSGEVEVRETIATGGNKKGSKSAAPSTEKLHLGLIGPGELLSDAAVFETPLIHPWEIVSRTPVQLYSITSEEFTKRIRADILVNIRKMSYAKKAFRDALRIKAHRTVKQSHLQSPKIKQAHKLLAQITGGSSTNQKHTSEAPIPRAIRATVLKNVVVGADFSNSGSIPLRQSDTSDRPRTSHSTALPPFISPSQIIGEMDEQTGQVYLQGHTQTQRLSSIVEVPQNSARRMPHPPSHPQPQLAQRPFTSPVISAQPAAAFETDESDFGRPDPIPIRFALTTGETEIPLPIVNGVDGEDEVSSRPSTGVAQDGRSGRNRSTSHADSNVPEKGSLLVQKNPFAYDHTTFISPLSAEKVASLSQSTKNLIHVLTAPPRPTSISPTRRRYDITVAGASAASILASTAPRMPYPFDHIHLSEGRAPNASNDSSVNSSPKHGPLSPSASGSVSARRLRGRQHSISMSLGPGGALSVGMPDGAVHTIEEHDTEPMAPSSLVPLPQPTAFEVAITPKRPHERRPSSVLSPPPTSTPTVVAPSPSHVASSQIKGHQRSVSSHRGSVVIPSTLPFALSEGDKTSLSGKKKGALDTPNRPILSEAAMQISAPVLILPTAKEVLSSAMSPAGVIPKDAEIIAPVPSFAHMPTNFYTTVPEKQYYGKLEYRRPSVALTPAQAASINSPTHTGSGVPMGGSTSVTNLGSGLGLAGPAGSTPLAGFQKPSQQQQQQQQSFSHSLSTVGESGSGPGSPQMSLTPSNRKMAGGVTGQNSVTDVRGPSAVVTPRLSVFARNDPTLAQPINLLTSVPHPLSPSSSDLSAVGSSQSCSSSSGLSVNTSAASLHSPTHGADLSRQGSVRDGVGVGGGRNSGGATMSVVATSGSSNQRTTIVAPVPILASVSDEEDADTDELFSGFDSTGAPKRKTRNQALLESTAAALLLDPLLLQKENRKWERQLTSWHRKLVVASSAFLENRKDKTIDAKQDTLAPVGTQPLVLTPDNIDVFTTRTDLTPAQLASPLSLIPHALPPPQSHRTHAPPFLYPTTRETGSMTQTRALNSALTNLQDAIASGFTKPILTAGQQAALDLERSEHIKRKLEEELALKRLIVRMRPEDELIMRRHYIPRELRPKVASKQQERRKALWSPVPVNESESGKRRRRNMDVGLDGKTPEQRLLDDTLRKRILKERAEAKKAALAAGLLPATPKWTKRKLKKQQTAENAETKSNTASEKDEKSEGRDGEGEHQRKRPSVLLPIVINTEEQLYDPIPSPVPVSVDVPSTPPPDPSNLNDPRNMPLPGYSHGKFLTKDSSVYALISKHEHEAVVLAKAISMLDRPDGLWLGSVVRSKKGQSPIVDTVNESTDSSLSKSVVPDQKNESTVAATPDQPKPVPNTSLKPTTSRQKSMQLMLPEEKDSWSIEAPAARVRLSEVSRSLASTSSQTRLSAPSTPIVGPRLTSDQRVLHSGTLELNLDRELEYGREWKYFEEKAKTETKRGQEFEKLLAVTGGDALLMQRMLRSTQGSMVDLKLDGGTLLATPSNGSSGGSSGNKVLAALERHGALVTGTSPRSTDETAPPSPLSPEEVAQRQLVAAVRRAEARQAEYSIDDTRAQLRTPAGSLGEHFASSARRPLIALTQHDAGDSIVLGSAAPRLYHWSAMVHSLPRTQTGVPGVAHTTASKSQEMKDMLSDESLRLSLHAPIPHPPPAGAPARIETLAELNSEIALYRRDLRMLRKDIHSSGNAGDISQRALGLHTAQAKAQSLARKTHRDMVGSTASPMAKILKLRQLVGHGGSFTSRPSSQSASTSDVDLGDPNLSVEWSAKRFWRQSFRKRYWTRHGMIEHAERMMTHREEKGEEDQEEVSGKQIAAPIQLHGPTNTTIPVTHPPASTHTVDLPLSPSPSSPDATVSSGVLLPSISSSSSTRRPSTSVQSHHTVLVVKPTLADVMQRTQTTHGDILIDPTTFKSPVQEFYEYLNKHSQGKKSNLFGTTTMETPDQ